MDFQDRIDRYMMARSVAWRVELDQWEDSQLSEVLKSVDQARGEIIAELEDRAKQMKVTKWTDDRLKSLLNEMEGLTLGIKDQLGEDLDDIATTAATKTVEEYNDIMSVSGTMPGFNNVELSPEQLRSMIATPLGGLQAAEVVKNAFDHNLVDRVKQDIDAGVLRGESYRKLVDRVQENWGGARNDVISITRTQVQEMNNRASWEVADQNRDIMQQQWEWSAILDNRACIRCASLDGQRFDFDDPIPIPRHIRCRCLRRYLTKSYRELGVDIDEMEEPLRNWVLRDGQVGVGGAVAEKMGKFRGSYREFFKDLPYKRQVEIVGKTRADLIRKGKLNFDDLADSRGQVFALNKGRTGLADKMWDDVDVGKKPTSAILQKSPDDLNDIYEAKEWAEAKFPNITFDFEELDIEAVKPTVKQIDKLSKDYPEVAGRLQYVGGYRGKGMPQRDFASDNTWAHATRDGKEIGLNPLWFKDKKTFDETLKINEKIGWHPKGCDSVESLITHEFGHQVQNWYKEAGKEKMFAGAVRTSGLGIVRDTVDIFLNSNKATKKLSRYALTNNSEAWAESFSMIYHSPKKDWPVFVKRHNELLKVLGNDSSKWSSEYRWLHEVTDKEERSRITQRLKEIARKITGKGTKL